MAVILMVIAGALWWYSRQGSDAEITLPALLDELVYSATKAVRPTELPDMLATQTPVPSAARVDTPTSSTMPPVQAHTPEPTYTPKPTRTPRPTSTTPPTPPPPTQIPGRTDLYKPIYPPNHMAVVHWTWGSGYNGFQSIDFEFTIHNDIDVDVLHPDHGLYLMLDNGSVSGTSYYFGLQIDHGEWLDHDLFGLGHSRACIFSRWETRDLDNVQVPENGYFESAGYEGDFVSVRRQYPWGPGDYHARIAADGEDDEGRWFGLWITEKATGETTWCGSLRFPYKDGEALLENIHGSVAEIYGGPVGIKPIDIPEWYITIQKPMADGSRQPAEAHISYTNHDGRPSVPNTSVEYDSKEGSIHIYVGGATQRTTEEGWISLDVK